MGKKSAKNEVKQPSESNRKIKKQRRRMEEPDSVSGSEDSEQIDKEPLKINKHISRNSKKDVPVQEQEQIVRKKHHTRSVDPVGLKIKNAFKKAEQDILARAKQMSEEEQEVSDQQDDVDQELEAQSSEITPLDQDEQAEESEQNSNSSQKKWTDGKLKNTKKSKKPDSTVLPGFHRKIQISYQIMDKKQGGNSINCLVDGKDISINQSAIIGSLETMRKSIQNLEFLFRNSAISQKLVAKNADQLVEKYSKQSSQMNKIENYSQTAITPISINIPNIANKKEERSSIHNKKEQKRDKMVQQHKQDKNNTVSKVDKRRIHKKKIQERDGEKRINIE